MRLTFKLSIREHSYLTALMIVIIERTLLKGIDWRDVFHPLVGIGTMLLDGAVILLLTVSFIADVVKRRRWFHLAVILTLGLLAVSAGITRQNGLLYSAAFIFLARGIPYARIIRVFYRTALCSLVLLILAQAIGFTNPSARDLEYNLGYSMGMAHPNGFASKVTVVLFSWAYLRRWKRRFKVLLTVLAVAFLTFWYTISRTALVISLVYCPSLVLYDLLNRFHFGRAVRIIRLGFAALLLSSVWLMLNSEAVFERLGLLSDSGISLFMSALNRFITASALFEQNGLRLFGSYIEFRSLRDALLTNQEAVILDSAYLYLVISQGIAATMIMFWLFAKSMRAQIRKKQYVLLITMGVFLLSGLMERYALDSAMNFTLLSAFSALETDVPNEKKRAAYAAGEDCAVNRDQTLATASCARG